MLMARQFSGFLFPLSWRTYSLGFPSLCPIAKICNEYAQYPVYFGVIRFRLLSWVQ